MNNTPDTKTQHPKHRAEPDGAPQTREEVTAGYINPSQARMAAWQQKQELTR